jgi:hypothetical protein
MPRSGEYHQENHRAYVVTILGRGLKTDDQYRLSQLYQEIVERLSKTPAARFHNAGTAKVGVCSCLAPDRFWYPFDVQIARELGAMLINDGWLIVN